MDSRVASTTGRSDSFAKRLALAAHGGVDPATLARHLPMLRRCVPADDRPVLLARATRAGNRDTYLVLVTNRRMVVTAESRIWRRRRLHLAADPWHLGDVLWTPEPDLGGLALSATAMDGVREHLWLRTPNPVAAADALEAVFGPTVVALPELAALVA
jgi:hypothetical protein